MKGYEEERQQGRRDKKEMRKEKQKKETSPTHLHQQKGWDRGRWVGSPPGCCAHGSC